MKQAKFWCSLAIVALSSAYAGGCSAIYASCSQDSDCDLVRGEVCIKEDGYRGVCALPQRECSIDSEETSRQCFEGCGEVSSVTKTLSCQENGRWTGCLGDEASLSCPTGYLLVDSQTHEVVETALKDNAGSIQGNRGDYLCLACDYVDSMFASEGDTNPYSVQCCGEHGDDVSNFYCCMHHSLENMSEACREKHIVPLILKTSSQRDMFCLVDKNSDEDVKPYQLAGHEVEVWIENKDVEACAARLYHGESNPHIAIDLKTFDQKQIGLFMNDACRTDIRMTDARLNIGFELDKTAETEGVSCEALFVPQTYRLLRAHGERVECDTINDCDPLEAWQMFEVQRSLKLDSDVGLTCDATDEMIEAANDCRKFMVGEVSDEEEDDGEDSDAPNGAPHARTRSVIDRMASSKCFLAIASQYEALSRYCSMTSEITDIGQSELCIHLFDELSKEFIIACAGHNMVVNSNDVMDRKCLQNEVHIDPCPEGACVDDGVEAPCEGTTCQQDDLDNKCEGDACNSCSGVINTWDLVLKWDDYFSDLENTPENMRDMILNAVFGDYQWADEAMNKRIAGCLWGTCDVREQLENGGYLYEICPDQSMVYCDQKAQCQPAKANVRMEMPSCRQSNDEADGKFALDSETNAILTAQFGIKENEEACVDEGCQDDGGEGAQGAPVAREPGQPKVMLPDGFKVDSFDVVHVILDGVPYDIVAIAYQANPISLRSEDNAIDVDEKFYYGAISLAFYTPDEADPMQMRRKKELILYHNLEPVRVWSDKEYTQPLTLNYALCKNEKCSETESLSSDNSGDGENAGTVMPLSFSMRNVHIAVSDNDNNKSLHVYYMADRPLGSVTELYQGGEEHAQANSIGITSKKKNYTDHISEVYVQKLMMDQLLSEENPDGTFYDMDRVPLYPEFYNFDDQFHCDLSKWKESDLNNACDMTSSLWTDKNKNGACLEAVIQKCEYPDFDAAQSIVMDRNHHANVSIRRVRGEESYIQYDRYGHDISEVYSVGQKGMHTTDSVCLREQRETFIEDVKAGLKEDETFQTAYLNAFYPLSVGQYFSYRFQSDFGEEHTDVWAFGVVVPDDLMEEETGTENDASDAGTQGGSAPLARSPETESERLTVPSVILTKLASFDVLECGLYEDTPESTLSMQSDSPNWIVWQGALPNENGENHGDSWVPSLLPEHSHLYVSDIRFLSWDKLSGSCGVWMGVWPATYNTPGEAGETPNQETVLMAGRVGICLDHYGHLTYSDNLNEAPRKVMTIGDAQIRQISIEPYRADTALIHVSKMTKSGEKTTVGRLNFMGEQEADLLVLEAESQSQTAKVVQSILYPDDHLFTLFDDGHVQKTKISCIGD